MAGVETSKAIGLKERFFRYFQQEVVALQEQMDRLAQLSPSGGERNDAIDHCLAGIDRLAHEVKDASTYVPAYDQRAYGQAIKALSEKLQGIRNSLNPPQRFQFKSRKIASPNPTSDATEPSQSQKLQISRSVDGDSNINSLPGPATPNDSLIGKEKERQRQATMEDESEDGMSDTENGAGILNPSFSKANKITISKRERLHIVLPAAASHATTSGILSNLRQCVVDLSIPTINGAPFAALYLKNIKDSLIVCGQVVGPIHVTNLENSVIVISCGQFRMHGSESVDIYLHCTSRPIFEDCHDLRFAPLPKAYMTDNLSQSANLWDQIDDFKWLKEEPSPHFSILSEAQRVGDAVWEDKVHGEHNASLDKILKAVKTS